MTVQLSLEQTISQDSDRLDLSDSQISGALFQSIPPERMGLQGEYDHHGLAKRVGLLVRQNFTAEQLGSLRITQRGAVVVFSGKIPNQRLLIQLVNLAMATTGAADVEVNGVSLGDSLKSYLEVKPRSDLLLQLQPLVER